MRNFLLVFLVLYILFTSNQSALWSDESITLFDTNPRLVLEKIQKAYDGKIEHIDYDTELQDWFIIVQGTRLYWSHGRILLEKDRASYLQWRPLVDYVYPRNIPDPSTYSDELIASLNGRVLEEKRSTGPVYNHALYNLLYDGASRISIEKHIVRYDYLGKRVSTHKDIVEPLRRIEKKIRDEAQTDEEVAAFLENLLSTEGYNWREIADSPTRSTHSWGIAIDLLPKNWGKKNVYWYWISYWNDAWMLIPPSRRWMPPMKVVEIFESEGFIWGGKWHLWDTMHFEYRPELLLLQQR